METKSKVFRVVYPLAVVATVVLIMGIFSLAPTQAHASELTAGSVVKTQSAVATSKAKGTNPYPDVTVKKVGKTAWNSIKFVKSKGGYKGIIRGTYYKKVGGGLYKKVTGKFKPSKVTSKKEFINILGNMYGEKKVPVAYADLKNANKPVTDKWAKAKLVGLAKKGFGVKITWGNGTNKKLSRATTANYLSVFAHFDKAFMPA